MESKGKAQLPMSADLARAEILESIAAAINEGEGGPRDREALDWLLGRAARADELEAERMAQPLAPEDEVDDGDDVAPEATLSERVAPQLTAQAATDALLSVLREKLGRDSYDVASGLLWDCKRAAEGEAAERELAEREMIDEDARERARERDDELRLQARVLGFELPPRDGLHSPERSDIRSAIHWLADLVESEGGGDLWAVQLLARSAGRWESIAAALRSALVAPAHELEAAKDAAAHPLIAAERLARYAAESARDGALAGARHAKSLLDASERRVAELRAVDSSPERLLKLESMNKTLIRQRDRWERDPSNFALRELRQAVLNLDAARLGGDEVALTFLEKAVKLCRDPVDPQERAT